MAISATAVMLMALAGCAAGPPSPKLVTSNGPDLSGMEALLTASLQTGDDGCVYAYTDAGTVTLVWPKGYVAVGDATSFTVVDAQGTAVARSGAPLSMGGGMAERVSDEWDNPGCATDSLWLVGQLATP